MSPPEHDIRRDRGKQLARSVIKNFDYPRTGVALQPGLADETQLVRTDPFAFLSAVLFDQGVPAERAWLAPMLLHPRPDAVGLPGYAV